MTYLNNVKVKEQRKVSGSMKKLHRRDDMILWLIALPGVIALFLLNYVPMYGIIIAFKDFFPVKGIWGSEWNGLANFEFFFTSVDGWRVIRNTVGYGVTFIIVDTIFGLAGGIALYNLASKIGRKVYNTIMILPRFLSPVLIAYIVYALLCNHGVVNALIEKMGSDAISFYTRPEYWPIILTVVHIWGSVGMKSIMYLSALSGLDTNLVEAAKVDGAKGRQIIWHVYIPHLYPIIAVLVILATGDIFKGDFGLFYQVPMDKGTLYPTTDIIPTYVFRGLKDANFGASTAIGLVQSVVGCIMVILSNFVVKKISPENSLF